MGALAHAVARGMGGDSGGGRPLPTARGAAGFAPAAVRWRCWRPRSGCRRCSVHRRRPADRRAARPGAAARCRRAGAASSSLRCSSAPCRATPLTRATVTGSPRPYRLRHWRSRSWGSRDVVMTCSSDAGVGLARQVVAGGQVQAAAAHHLVGPDQVGHRAKPLQTCTRRVKGKIRKMLMPRNMCALKTQPPPSSARPRRRGR